MIGSSSTNVVWVFKSYADCLLVQIEHHLFPAISFMHYPAIAAIVADECKKRGINVSEANVYAKVLFKLSSWDIAVLCLRAPSLSMTRLA